jgi:hypothetical protein
MIGAVSRPIGGYILAGRKDHPIILDNLAKRVIRPALEEAKIEWHGWYSLRRFLGTAVRMNADGETMAKAVLRKNSMDGIDPSFECSVFAVCARCFTRRDRGVKLPRHPPSLPLCNSSMTAGDLALRAGSVERTGARAVAESLSAVTALARDPVIDDHLHLWYAKIPSGSHLTEMLVLICSAFQR